LAPPNVANLAKLCRIDRNEIVSERHPLIVVGQFRDLYGQQQKHGSSIWFADPQSPCRLDGRHVLAPQVGEPSLYFV
jgi:hypothetical protein